MKLLMSVVGMLLLSIVGLGWLQGDAGEYFRFDEQAAPVYRDWVSLIGLAVATILGLFCGTLFERLRKYSTDRINWTELSADFLHHRKTVMALLVSPIIYFSILKIVDGTVNDVSDVLLAFQNAFFWESVFSIIATGKMSEHTQPAPPVTR